MLLDDRFQEPRLGRRRVEEGCQNIKKNAATVSSKGGMPRIYPASG